MNEGFPRQVVRIALQLAIVVLFFGTLSGLLRIVLIAHVAGSRWRGLVAVVACAGMLAVMVVALVASRLVNCYLRGDPFYLWYVPQCR